MSMCWVDLKYIEKQFNREHGLILNINDVIFINSTYSIMDILHDDESIFIKISNTNELYTISMDIDDIKKMKLVDKKGDEI